MAQRSNEEDRTRHNGWLSAHGKSAQSTLYVLRRGGVELGGHLNDDRIKVFVKAENGKCTGIELDHDGHVIDVVSGRGGVFGVRAGNPVK